MDRLLPATLLLVILTSLGVLQAQAQEVSTVVFVADNQQRDIFGATSGLSASEAQFTSHVAVRSSEQELFSKYLVREIVDRESKASVVVHLGDLLDYSCESEWRALASALDNTQGPEILVTPGNHDGLFQGNSEYGALFKFGLQIRKIFNRSYDPGLQGHANSVCRSRFDSSNKFANYNFRKRDFFCSYFIGLAPKVSLNIKEINDACQYVSLARQGPVDGSDKAVIRYPTPASMRISTSSSKFEYGVVSQFPSRKTASWSEGYFIQVAKIKPVNGGATTHILLLDTTDWDKSPELGVVSEVTKVCTGNYSSNCGSIRREQMSIANNYLASIPSKDEVILAGHYPLRAMEKTAADWVMRLISKSPGRRVYMSAHTHSGYIDHFEKDGRIGGGYEINSDSLVDWPSSYWRATVGGTDSSMCFTPVNLWDEFDCEQVLSVEKNLILGAVQRYRMRIKKGFFDQGEEQWRWRAQDAFRVMTSFISRRGLSISCVSPNFDKDSLQVISEAAQDCQRLLDNVLQGNRNMRVAAACASIMGGAAFVGKLPSQTIPRDYHQKCIR